MASFSFSERNGDDVGVRGRKKKDRSPNATVKDPSYSRISSAIAAQLKSVCVRERERNVRDTY